MRVCSIEGCESKLHSKEFCNKHYLRYKIHGDPLYEVKKLENHGMRYSKEYRAWQGMNDRCYNPNNAYYYRYGGRGITVCDEWRNSFSNFYEYIGDRPDDKTSLDRINPDGNYQPGNIRWADWNEQANNKSKIKTPML